MIALQQTRTRYFFLALTAVLVVLILAGSAAAETVDTNSINDYCTFVPVVNAAAAPGAAPGGAPPDCLQVATDIVDFNGDGNGDLAVGVPGDNPAAQDSGAVNVLYGKSTGLSAAESQYWTQSLAGGLTEQGDNFGNALSSGDYNMDGYTDLAIGSPGETHDGDADVGRVDILFGSAEGLTATGAQSLDPANPAIDNAPEAGDRFGLTLESGDFNGDGYSDLAVGIPYEDYEAGSIQDMGAVIIFYGSSGGLRLDNELPVHPALATVDGTATAFGNFGRSLAAGNFNNDDYDDLAVGIPGYDLNMVDRAGAVEVFKGSAGGISLLGETLWRQGFNGIQGNPEDLDNFGFTLAAGDFDKNGADDLAVGVPYEGVEPGGPFSNAGAVQIIYGFALSDGLSGAGDQIWHQGLAGVLGDPGANYTFGYALAAEDFNGDGADDLAVGIPGANSARGQVIAFYSNGSILSLDNQDLFQQGIVQGAPESNDYFGWSLGASDFDGNGITDLAVGAPYEDVLFNGVTYVDAGAIHAIYAENTGLGVTGNQIFGQHVDGIDSDPFTEDYYGWALSH